MDHRLRLSRPKGEQAAEESASPVSTPTGMGRKGGGGVVLVTHRGGWVPLPLDLSVALDHALREDDCVDHGAGLLQHGVGEVRQRLRPRPDAEPQRRPCPQQRDGFSLSYRPPGKTKTVHREKIAFGTCTSESTWTSWRARGTRRPLQRSSRRRRWGPRRCTGRGSPAARPARTPPRRASRSRRALGPSSTALRSRRFHPPSSTTPSSGLASRTASTRLPRPARACRTRCSYRRNCKSPRRSSCASTASITATTRC